jgi:uncharacterized protein YbbC (DUF1343 family)/CubicO group peptidase (beta-lactamase class C family)
MSGSIEALVEKEISEGRIPGAVILVGNREGVIYEKAFGYSSLKPARTPMTVDTIFDIASLTKVVATAPAIMQLVERGKLGLNDPVARYWPEFKAKGKERITIRQLLTHYSGLRPDIPLKPAWSGYATAVRKIEEMPPLCPPGTRFIYSDINFIALGELLRRVTGQPLDEYCAEQIFRPLAMTDTGFSPPKAVLSRIAPCDCPTGLVQDPTARAMGGVAGNAGLFSTARDLSLFCTMILNRGLPILSPPGIEKMTTPQSPFHKTAVRGLGWDIDSPYSSNRGSLFPVGSFGHKGYTGTSLWIDPFSGTYIITLTSRLHPAGKGNAEPLRERIATIVAAALSDSSGGNRDSITGYYELLKGYPTAQPRQGHVMTGIDLLREEGFKPLKGLRIGLITNRSGIDSQGRRTAELLSRNPSVKLAAIFSPEHGLGADRDEKVASSRDLSTGLPVYSLYGDNLRPADEMLKGIDALVFDIQDVGARFYTYITTMAYAMEAAAKKGIRFFVLDRPNPITAAMVQGPLLEEGFQSFTGCFPMPVRHGMTVGELALMFNKEMRLEAKLEVISMKGYRRTDWYDETGLPWVNPSPNIRTLNQAVLYPGVALVEGANLSVGRGTDNPFEIVGAPWIRAEELASYLNRREIQGVRFMPVEFVPRENRFRDKICRGIQIIITDRQALDAAGLGIELITALYRLQASEFQIDKTAEILGAPWIIRAIKEGADPAEIQEEWYGPLSEFMEKRERYLLY